MFLRLEPALDGSECTDLHGNAGAVDDHLLGEGGNARAGGEDADEVQRVGGRYHDRLRLRRLPALGSEPIYGLGQGKLFTDKAGDEASAADFATGFQATIYAKQGSPGWDLVLTGEKLTEYDAVSAQ
jgi:hypothetical protein